MAARWPALEGEVDKTLLKEADYLSTVSHEFRVRLKKMMDIREKVGSYMYKVIVYQLALYMILSPRVEVIVCNITISSRLRSDLRGPGVSPLAATSPGQT